MGIDEDTVHKYYEGIGGIRPMGPKSRILFFEKNIVSALRREAYAFEYKEERTNSMDGKSSEEGKTKYKYLNTKKEALDWEAEERKKDWSATDTESSVSMMEWAQQHLDYAESRYSAKTYSEKKPRSSI